jgi:PIN domain nuclease of toxin-antitoxin system
VCAISFWEAAQLHRAGRIALPYAAERWRAEMLGAGIQEIPVDGHIGIVATELTDLHRDPADRFIIATALRHDAELITADAAILDWKSDLRRRDARS